MLEEIERLRNEMRELESRLAGRLDRLSVDTDRRHKENQESQWTLKVGWGSRYVAARGLAVVILLGLAALIGSSVYLHLQREKEHERLESAMQTYNLQINQNFKVLIRLTDQATCLASMTSDEKQKFRSQYRPENWSYWCGWMER